MARTIIIHDDLPILKRIRKYVAKVDAELGVDKALLFGSTANRKRRKESDIDLIIVSKSFAGIPVPKRLGILENMWDYEEDLETLAYTPKEFEEAKDRFLMKEILSYAIELTQES